MFSTKQLQILAFAKLDFDMLICDGTIRSGKTSIMTVAFIDWAMQSFNECNLAICGKTVGSAIKNIVKPYMALTYARDKYDIKFNRSRRRKEKTLPRLQESSAKGFIFKRGL